MYIWVCEFRCLKSANREDCPSACAPAMTMVSGGNSKAFSALGRIWDVFRQELGCHFGNYLRSVAGLPAYMVKSTWTCHYRPLHPLPACEAHDDGLPKFSLEEAPFKGIDIGLGCRLWRGVRPLRLPLIPMLPWTQSGWMASEPKHRRWRLVAWLHKEVLLQCPGPRM